MLWYKSYREIRTIWLAGVLGLTAACLLIVLNQQTMRMHADAPMTYAAYVWKSVYNSLGRDLFAMLSIILGSSGLLQERTRRTSSFTLSFPVSRRRHVLMRGLIGYLGVVSLAAVPVVAVPVISRSIGEQYPIQQSVGFFFLWAGCGAVFYGLTFLLAHVLEADYLSVLLAVPSLMVYGALMNLPWLAELRMLNIFNILNGEHMTFFDEARHLLVGPLPWLALAVMLIVGAALVAVAARRVEPLDF